MVVFVVVFGVIVKNFKVSLRDSLVATATCLSFIGVRTCFYPLLVR